MRKGSGRTEAQHIDRFWQLVDKTEDCWNWLGLLTPSGYARLPTKFLGQQRAARALMAYLGFNISGKIVCHHCDNRKCVRPEHLYVGTHKDNTQDKVRRERVLACFGETHPAVRLTDKQCAEIRARFCDGETVCEIRKSFPDHSHHAVWQIATGRRRNRGSGKRTTGAAK